MPYGLAVTATVDVLEVLILVLFLGATGLAAFNATDAWKNELVALDRGDPDVALLGLEDLARAWIKLLFLAVPGVVTTVLLMTIPSPMGVANPTPEALVAGLGLRVGLLLMAVALVGVTGLSAWLRRRVSGRWERDRLARADRLVAETAAAVALGRRLEASVAAVGDAVAANREATEEAAAKAAAAYEAANTVNEKIAGLGERQVALTERQDADRVEDRAVGDALTATTDAIRTDTEEIKATTAETRDAVRGNGQ
jgi:hypothetical protein